MKEKVIKMSKEKNEEFEVKGEELLTKIKELIKEGNIRRITIKSEEGKTLIQIPLTLGVVGAILLPVWAAIGAIAAIVTKATISIERE
jgi:competence protein ComGC